MVPDKKLLLMGSSAYKADKLPSVVRQKIDDAILQGMRARTSIGAKV